MSGGDDDMGWVGWGREGGGGGGGVVVVDVVVVCWTGSIQPL